MNLALNWLRGIRASNLVFIAIAPVIIWLIASSRNYGPALKAVLGIEPQPWVLLSMFLLCAILFASGFLGASLILRSVRPDDGIEMIVRNRSKAAICFAIQLIASLVIMNTTHIDTYIVSVVSNELDARTSDYIIISDNMFLLDEDFKVAMLKLAHVLMFWIVGTAFVSLIWALFPLKLHCTFAGRLSWVGLLFVNFTAAFYVIMVAHSGFSVGLMITLRAAFFAYIGASILGLVWAMFSRLKPSPRALIYFTVLGFVLILVSIWQFTRPHEEVALVGNLGGRIGIVSGTPQGLADTIRYGDFQGVEIDKPYKIRSLASVDQAVDLLDRGSITAVLVPFNQIGQNNVIWKTNYLPVVTKTTAIVCLALGVLLLLLSGIGALIGAHPLVVFSDFFVDTIRGVPMLVIILYVGLPLAGAIKSASVGYIDLQMMTRGIIAIAIGYSAYMAEIFRAGIEAVPKGQIEGARTLGLREWQIARFIIVPQAISIVLPALGNEFIAMLKDTSLLSILSIRDLTQRMREFQAQSFLVFEPFNSAALIYVFLTLIAASGIKALNTVVNRGKSH